MNTEQKLILLRTATAHPFTTKSALLATLSAKFPSITLAEIEEFFDGMVDFEAVQKWQQEREEKEREREREGGSYVPVTEDPKRDHTVTHSPISRAQSLSPIEPQKPSLSPQNSPPPLVVPARTPSGRTLRSNSTVNTSEPRRLRSNK